MSDGLEKARPLTDAMRAGEVEHISPVAIEAARARAEVIRTYLADLSVMAEKIAEAYVLRDDQTLGYESWAAYVDREYGAALTAVSRAGQRFLTLQLAREGMPVRAIAAATGTSKSTVDRELSQNGTPDRPEVTAGLDGKSYPSTRPAAYVVTPGWTESDSELAEQAMAELEAAADPDAPPPPPRGVVDDRALAVRDTAISAVLRCHNALVRADDREPEISMAISDCIADLQDSLRLLAES